MRVGKYTFIDVLNKDGKRSRQPLWYILARGHSLFCTPSGNPLEVEFCGMHEAVEIDFRADVFEHYSGKTYRPLTLSAEETLQGIAISDLRGKNPTKFRSLHGDAVTKAVRSVRAELFETNAETINGIYV